MLELNWVLLEEQSVSTTEPSLQSPWPRFFFFLTQFFFSFFDTELPIAQVVLRFAI